MKNLSCKYHFNYNNFSPTRLIPGTIPPKQKRYGCTIYDYFDKSSERETQASSNLTKKKPDVPIPLLTAFENSNILNSLSPACKTVEQRRNELATGTLSVGDYNSMCMEIEEEQSKKSKLPELLSEFRLINGHDLEKTELVNDNENNRPLWYKREFAGKY